MLSHELLQAWRESVSDTQKPYLWSDAEAYRFMDDAYFMFARLTGGIGDFESPEMEVEVRAGEKLADLHPSILRITGATLRSTGHPVEVINFTDMGRLTTQDYGGRAKVRDFDLPGRVTHMVTGLSQGRVRLIMVPVEDDIIDLTGYRLPLCHIAGDGQQLRDVSVYHHPHLMHWMSYLAYSKQDADAFDPRKADFHKSEFEAYCAQVQREWERYKHKNRVVAYGGL